LPRKAVKRGESVARAAASALSTRAGAAVEKPAAKTYATVARAARHGRMLW